MMMLEKVRERNALKLSNEKKNEQDQLMNTLPS